MISKQQAAEELLRRREARRDFGAWCRLIGYVPVRHHQLVIDVLQAMTEGKPLCEYTNLAPIVLRIKPDFDISQPLRKAMFLMPPGSAKSTYTSKAFPPWFLGKRPTDCILSCSYAKDLVVSFGRAARNNVGMHENVLGYKLKVDSKAADEWETSLGGRYFCAGVNAGIAGHRADCGLIDDPIGSEADADSKLFRKQLKNWYINDFIPRLKPNAIQIIIANRRHEMDLCGMLLNSTDDDANGIMSDKDEWLVLRIPFFCDSLNDPVGRAIGEPLWPEYFNEVFSRTVAKMPARTKAGLYQQKPAPEEGNYFKAAWLNGYEPQDLPPLTELRVYTASDHAISKREEANKSCFLSVGVDCNDEIWVLPHCFWQRADAEEQIDGMILQQRRYPSVSWRAEKGHISKSLLPFLRKKMRQTGVYINIHEYTPTKDKQSRARSIQGRMSMGMVHFPKFASWWADAEHDLLQFDSGKDDDFVDALAHIGNQLDQMAAPDSVSVPDERLDATPVLDFKWLKQQTRRQELVKLQDAD